MLDFPAILVSRPCQSQIGRRIPKQGQAMAFLSLIITNFIKIIVPQVLKKHKPRSRNSRLNWLNQILPRFMSPAAPKVLNQVTFFINIPSYPVLRTLQFSCIFCEFSRSFLTISLRLHWLTLLSRPHPYVLYKKSRNAPLHFLSFKDYLQLGPRRFIRPPTIEPLCKIYMVISTWLNDSWVTPPPISFPAGILSSYP